MGGLKSPTRHVEVLGPGLREALVTPRPGAAVGGNCVTFVPGGGAIWQKLRPCGDSF